MGERGPRRRVNAGKNEINDCDSGSDSEGGLSVKRKSTAGTEHGRAKNEPPQPVPVATLSFVVSGLMPVLVVLGLIGCAWWLAEPLGFLERVRKPNLRLKLVGAFLCGYCFLLHALRVIVQGWHYLAETLWACNVSLTLAGVGMITERPLLVGCAICIVGLDQLAWYLDCFGFLVLRKWPIGVAKYLTSSQLSTVQLVTSFHHLFFLPLCFWALHGWEIGMPDESYIWSVLLTSTLAIAARILTPYAVVCGHDRSDKSKKNSTQATSVHVFNVNMSYAFWDDVKIPGVHLLDFRSPFLYLPYLIVVCNLYLNTLVVVFLYAFANYLCGDKPNAPIFANLLGNLILLFQK